MRPVLAFLVLGACAAPDTDDWTDQLVADSPCYRVDLLDGLDAGGTAELHDLYACLNRRGDFAALAGLDAALDAPTAAGVPAGLEVAAIVDALPASGIDPFALAGVLVDAIRAPGRPLDVLLDVALEAIYGRPAADVRVARPAVADGPIAPLHPVIPGVAAALLADDLALSGWLGDLLVHPETARWIRSTEGTARSTDPSVAGPRDAAIPDLGHARLLTLDASNDRWPGASGDSLRDAAAVWALGPVVPAVADEASALLGDPAVRAGIQADLVRLQGDGTLARAVDGAHWMTTVDVRGGSLDPAETSGLHGFVRLLADTNQPMDCSIDLGITSIDFSFGNLAVSTLELIASTDPDTLQSAGSVYGLLFGDGIGELVLEEAADLGVCPGLTRQVVDDLAAVELLADPKAADVLVAFVAVIETLEAADRVPALADLVDDLYGAGGWSPTEELLRDLAPSPAIEDLLAAIPVLADPARYGVTAAGAPPWDLQAALDVLAWLVDRDPANGVGPDGLDRTGFDRISQLVTALLGPDGTWVAIDRAAALARDPRSETSGFVAAFPSFLGTDPDLVVLAQVAPLFRDPAVAGPVLRLAGTPAVLDAALADDAGAPQPLDFGGRLIAEGALEDMLVLVDLVFGTLGG